MIKSVIGIDQLCYETCPCQHVISYIDGNDETQKELLGSIAIWNAIKNNYQSISTLENKLIPLSTDNTWIYKHFSGFENHPYNKH